MKGNRFTQNFDARQILRAVGIDPFDGKENLVWAPNWKHSEAYAKHVLTGLQRVEGKGKRFVVLELNSLARDFIPGRIGSEPLPGDEDDDT
jgi:hypothetical protein